MRRFWRDERGFTTLTELLTAASIMIVVLGATLTAQLVFQTTADVNLRVNDAQDQLRSGVDRLTRDLRNLAGPPTASAQGIDRVGAYDFVFVTVDPGGASSGANVGKLRRVRYCLSTATPSNEALYSQTQTWTTAAVPAAPSDAACPGAGWGSQLKLADHLVNQINSQNRPLWIYDSATPSQVKQVRVQAWVDVKPGSRPGEVDLQSAVFLRNQVRRNPPTATFTSTDTSNLHVLLNASASADPDGFPLTYLWFDGSTQIGSGVTLDYQLPAPGTRTITLKVFDADQFESDATNPVS